MSASAFRRCWIFIFSSPMNLNRKCLEYVHFIEGRLAELPSEIEAGLDPQQIAKILGESLRQHFVQSGVPDTVARSASHNGCNGKCPEATERGSS